MTRCTFCGEKYDCDPTDGRCTLCRNKTARMAVITDKGTQTQGQIRDLHVDLAICDAATPGPWDSADTTDGFYILDADDYVLAATLERAADATFILESREGWPEAIRRAIAAEAEVERLAKRVNQLRQLFRECDPAIDYDKTAKGGYTWRAVMDELHVAEDEEEAS